MTDKFIIGIIGAPFGVKGFLKVRPSSGEIDHLLNLQSVIVSKDGKERTLQIDETTPSMPGVLIRFKGVESPEAAKVLTGSLLIAGREYAAPLSEGEFYIEDLKGLPVICSGSDEPSAASVQEDGKTIGYVTDIIEGGGGDLVEIELANSFPPDGSETGNRKEKRLIPLREMFFKEISVEKGRLLLQNTWILDTGE